MRTRDFRRSNAKKFKQRCKIFVRNHFTSNFERLMNNSRFIGKVSRTRKPCSCFMCGNPRKCFDQKTVGERRQEQAN